MKPLLLTFALTLTLNAADPLVGKWRINFEKSPGVKPEISKFDRDGEYLKNTNGPSSYRFKFDGKEYPATSTTYDTVVWRQTGPRKFEHETRKGGKTVYTVVTEVAADGKTRAYRNTRQMPDGETRVAEGVQERVGGETDPKTPLLGHWRFRLTSEWKQTGAKLHYRGGTVSYTVEPDGKDYPVTGSSTVDTISMRRVNPNTVEIITKKAGQAVSSRTATVDGDSLTFTDAKGVGTVWERVK